MKNESKFNGQHFWNSVFSIIFVIVAFYISYEIFKKNPDIIAQTSIFEFFILSLATFRLIRLITYDKIMAFLRDFFAKGDKGIRKTIYELLICPWCTGVWMVLLIMVLYFLIPLGNIFIFILAIAGTGSLIQSLVNMMGRIGNN